jgi:hypothetical protein
VEFLNPGGKIEHLAMLLGAQHHGDNRKTLHAMGQKPSGNLGLGGRAELSGSTAYWCCGRGADLNTIRLQGNPKRNITRKLGAIFCSQSIPAVCFTPHNSQIGVADSLRAP